MWKEEQKWCKLSWEKLPDIANFHHPSSCPCNNPRRLLRESVRAPRKYIKMSRKEKLKLGVKKLKSIAKNGWDKVKDICKPEIMTMNNNCCPNKGLIEA
jgi:hypothetical protein